MKLSSVITTLIFIISQSVHTQYYSRITMKSPFDVLKSQLGSESVLKCFLSSTDVNFVVKFFRFPVSTCTRFLFWTTYWMLKVLCEYLPTLARKVFLKTIVLLFCPNKSVHGLSWSRRMYKSVENEGGVVPMLTNNVNDDAIWEIIF